MNARTYYDVTTRYSMVGKITVSEIIENFDKYRYCYLIDGDDIEPFLIKDARSYIEYDLNRNKKFIVLDIVDDTAKFVTEV